MITQYNKNSAVAQRQAQAVRDSDQRALGAVYRRQVSSATAGRMASDLQLRPSPPL